jgi:AraC-like DNA-binding protein/DNA gyrase inhibitor GyrI
MASKPNGSREICMKLTLEQYQLNHRRMGKVMDYLDRHIDDDIRLETLAEVANLSRFHFERFYAAKAHETPIATLRRLRLKRAASVLLSDAAPSITELAVHAGYGSVAAFSKAFSRTFGVAPTTVMKGRLPDALCVPMSSDVLGREPLLSIAYLPPVPIVYHPFTGRAADVLKAYDEFGWRVASTGAPWQHWTVHPHGRTDPILFPDAQAKMWHCAPAATLPHRLAGVARGHLPSGTYARFTCASPHAIDLARLIARVEEESAWQVIDGATIYHFPKAFHYTPVPERCVHIHLPVAPRLGGW